MSIARTSQSIVAAVDLQTALRSNATAALPGLFTSFGDFSLESSELDDALVIVNPTTVPIYNTNSGAPCVDYGKAHLVLTFQLYKDAVHESFTRTLFELHRSLAQQCQQGLMCWHS